MAGKKGRTVLTGIQQLLMDVVLAMVVLLPGIYYIDRYWPGMLRVWIAVIAGVLVIAVSVPMVGAAICKVFRR